MEMGGIFLKKLVFCIFFSLLLIGCATTGSETTSTNDSTEQTTITDEQNTSQSPETSFIAPLTDQEALNLAAELNDSIYNLSILLYDEFSEENAKGPDPEVIELLKSYATETFIENYVTTMEGDCIGGCYTINMPWNIERGWQPKVTFISETQFETSALFPTSYATDYHDSSEEVTTFILEDGSWKMDSYTKVKKDMNLTVDDIEPYLTIQGFIIHEMGTEQTIKLFGQEEKVYPFTADADSLIPHILVARTGYTHTLDVYHKVSWENFDYVTDEEWIDVVYDTLFYPWEFHRDEIDASNPAISDFLTRLAVLDSRLPETYESQDIGTMQQMLDGYSDLYDEIYAFYDASWDDSYRQDYEMETRNWFFHYVNSLSDYLQDDYTEFDYLSLQAEAMKSRAYYMLVNEDYH